MLPHIGIILLILLNFHNTEAHFEDPHNEAILAKAEQFPFVAYIRVPEIQLPSNDTLPAKHCSGAVHSKNMVITSCRCVAIEIFSRETSDLSPELRKPKGIRVVVGTVNYNRGGQKRRAVKISAPIECQSYERILANDFSFIYVDKEFEFNTQVQPISVSAPISAFYKRFNQLVIDKAKCIVLGWPCSCKSYATDKKISAKDRVENLIMSQVTLQTSRTCKAYLERLQMLLHFPILPETEDELDIQCAFQENHGDEEPFLMGFTGAPLVCDGNFFGLVSTVILTRSELRPVLLFTDFGQTIDDFGGLKISV